MERAAAAGGVEEDARYLLERVRLGDLAQGNLELAAELEDPGAALAVPLAHSPDSEGWGRDFWKWPNNVLPDETWLLWGCDCVERNLLRLRHAERRVPGDFLDALLLVRRFADPRLRLTVDPLRVERQLAELRESFDHRLALGDRLALGGAHRGHTRSQLAESCLWSVIWLARSFGGHPMAAAGIGCNAAEAARDGANADAWRRFGKETYAERTEVEWQRQALADRLLGRTVVVWP